MKKRDAVIWGGTGNFMVLCELLADQYNIVGFFDNNPQIEPPYSEIPHLGTRDNLECWLKGRANPELPKFIVSIGPGFGSARLALHDDLKSNGLDPITAVHPTAFVASNATVGEGSMICAGATICVHTRVGKGCIINTGASVDHESEIGDGATIGPRAVLAGLVRVGKNADIYTGAVIISRVTIGEGAIVGAGAVVLEDVPAGAVVVGNPARVINKKP